MVISSILSINSAFALYGSFVKDSKDQFVASLLNNGSYFCSAVLISQTQVITAGHCIDEQGVEQYDSSHGLVYRPEELIVSVGKRLIRAREITLAPTYFEGLGFDAEDLALIELSSPVLNVLPIKFAPRSEMVSRATLTLIARNKKVETSVLYTKNYRTTDVLFFDKSAGACLGDSGGAVTINKNGQQLLAGILMYNGEEICEKKNGYSYVPKLRF